MPTYEYACTECGEQLEVVQSFTDDALTVCPACQGKLRKVFSPVGVVFKGSGFYKTDSRAAKSNGAQGRTRRATRASPRSPAATSSSASSDSSSFQRLGEQELVGLEVRSLELGLGAPSSSGRRSPDSSARRSERSERSKSKGGGSKVA